MMFFEDVKERVAMGEVRPAAVSADRPGDHHSPPFWRQRARRRPAGFGREPDAETYTTRLTDLFLRFPPWLTDDAAIWSIWAMCFSAASCSASRHASRSRWISQAGRVATK